MVKAAIKDGPEIRCKTKKELIEKAIVEWKEYDVKKSWFTKPGINHHWSSWLWFGKDDEDPKFENDKIETSDELDLDAIKEFMEAHKVYCSTIKKLNEKLSKRKIRNPNFPSEISENIVRIILKNKCGIDTTWDSPDLRHNGKKIEVKAFSSKGPTSFGPTE